MSKKMNLYLVDSLWEFEDSVFISFFLCPHLLKIHTFDSLVFKHKLMKSDRDVAVLGH